MALDDGGREPHPPEPRHLECDLPRRRGEATFVVADVVRRTLGGALIGAAPTSWSACSSNGTIGLDRV